MSRLFDDGSSEYLRHAAAVVSGVPFAMACWFNQDDDDAGCMLMSLDNGSNEFYIMGTSGADPGDLVSAGAYSGEWEIAQTSSGFTENTWHHAAAIFPDTGDRYVYIDGGSKGTHPGTEVVGIVNQTVIGSYKDFSSAYMSGMIAEAAIWDLSGWPGATGADKAAAFEKILPSLAKGFSPLLYPLGLKAYWPLIRGLNDKAGGYNLTATGSVIAAHPRVIYPTKAIQRVSGSRIVEPSTFELELSIPAPSLRFDYTLTPDTFELEIDLLLARMGAVFPILSTSPRIEGFTDEYSDETVIRDFYESGFPLLNPQFTLDLKNFLHTLKYVSNADKLTVMAFYLSNRDDNFFWTNEQDDDTIYEVIFVKRPDCQLDGANNEWKIDLDLKQVHA